VRRFARLGNPLTLTEATAARFWPDPRDVLPKNEELLQVGRLKRLSEEFEAIRNHLSELVDRHNLPPGRGPNRRKHDRREEDR
jgi:hypothetical protein